MEGGVNRMRVHIQQERNESKAQKTLVGRKECSEIEPLSGLRTMHDLYARVLTLLAQDKNMQLWWFIHRYLRCLFGDLKAPQVIKILNMISFGGTLDLDHITPGGPYPTSTTIMAYAFSMRLDTMLMTGACCGRFQLLEQLALRGCRTFYLFSGKDCGRQCYKGKLMNHCIGEKQFCVRLIDFREGGHPGDDILKAFGTFKTLRCDKKTQGNVVDYLLEKNAIDKLEFDEGNQFCLHRALDIMEKWKKYACLKNMNICIDNCARGHTNTGETCDKPLNLKEITLFLNQQTPVEGGIELLKFDGDNYYGCDDRAVCMQQCIWLLNPTGLEILPWYLPPVYAPPPRLFYLKLWMNLNYVTPKMEHEALVRLKGITTPDQFVHIAAPRFIDIESLSILGRFKNLHILEVGCIFIPNDVCVSLPHGLRKLVVHQCASLVNILAVCPPTLEELDITIDAFGAITRLNVPQNACLKTLKIILGRTWLSPNEVCPKKCNRIDVLLPTAVAMLAKKYCNLVELDARGTMNMPKLLKKKNQQPNCIPHLAMRQSVYWNIMVLKLSYPVIHPIHVPFVLANCAVGASVTIEFMFWPMDEQTTTYTIIDVDPAYKKDYKPMYVCNAKRLELKYALDTSNPHRGHVFAAFGTIDMSGLQELDVSLDWNGHLELLKNMYHSDNVTTPRASEYTICMYIGVVLSTILAVRIKEAGTLNVFINQPKGSSLLRCIYDALSLYTSCLEVGQNMYEHVISNAYKQLCHSNTELDFCLYKGEEVFISNAFCNQMAHVCIVDTYDKGTIRCHMKNDSSVVVRLCLDGTVQRESSHNNSIPMEKYGFGGGALHWFPNPQCTEEIVTLL
jgi:hypothetical protein